MEMKKKNVKAVIVMLLCVVALLCASFFLFKQNEKEDAYKKMDLQFKITEQTYEVDTDLTAIEFIKTKSDSITDIKYPKIDTTKVGNRTFIYTAFDTYGNEKQFILLLNIVDPVTPILTIRESNVSITEGDNIDLESYVVDAYDEREGKLEVTITKPKNYLEVGEHEIMYSVKKKNGNQVQAVLRLTVNPKPKVEEKPKEEENNRGNGSNGASGGDSNQVNPQVPQPPAPSTPKPPNRSFIFGQYHPETGIMYDMNTAPQYCNEYLFANQGYAGICRIVRNADGTLAGQEAIFY